MTEEPDIGPVAWKIWDALVNKNGLPLTILESDLIDITKHEALVLDRIRVRSGIVLEYDPVMRSQTLYEKRP